MAVLLADFFPTCNPTQVYPSFLHSASSTVSAEIFCCTKIQRKKLSFAATQEENRVGKNTFPKFPQRFTAIITNCIDRAARAPHNATRTSHHPFRRRENRRKNPHLLL
jgi:hypothetical protein